MGITWTRSTGITYRYGNYAGPGWTGGREVRPGQRGDYRARPVSPTDALARSHDWSYADADDARGDHDAKTADAIIWDADRDFRNGITDRIKYMNDQAESMSQEDWDKKYADEMDEATAIADAFDFKPTRFQDRPKDVNEDAVRRYQRNKLPPLPDTTTDPIDPNPIDPHTKDAFNNAKKWQPRRDPLTFDLNGNGLDTVGINTTNPLMFDHDGDGIKTSSGWVKAEDGFLVLDRNGNNMIDNGKELFGDATPLNGGGKAIDGFAALAQEDTNADGKVDQSDANWAQLHIWRDLNQDGQSQSNELFNLASLNIASIKVAKTENSTFLSNGNEIADLGSYTKTDGSSGTIGEVGKVADINLAQDTFTSHFTDIIPLAAGVSVLPNMSGSGVVRNLQEAASLDTDAGHTLKAKLEAFTAATTYTAQHALLNDLIIAWGATGNLTTSTIINQSTEDAKRFNTLEKFNGATIFTQTTNVLIEDGRKTVLNEAWQALSDSVYPSLLFQTRFKPLLDQIDFVIDAGGMRLDLSKVMTYFQQLMTTVSVNTLGSLIEFNKFGLPILADSSWAGYQLLEDTIRNTPLTPEITQIYKDVGIFIDPSQFTANAGVLKNTIVVGGNGNDVINAGSGSDLVFGGAGDDVINGGAGNDYIDGGAGNDILQGGLGNDTYVWGKGAGNDRISNYDNTPGRFDIIIMNSNTKPEDVSILTSGRDLRIKIKGTNEILLIGDGANRYGINENVMVNEIRFSDGTIWNTAKMKELALTGTDGDDSIEGFESDDIINGFAGNDVISGWGGNDILNGGAGNDYLGGGEGDDILDGGEGDDELSGMEGNDTIIWGKGSGSDSIETNETFENDSLDGVDTIKIKVGTLPSDIKVKFINFNLILMATDGSSLTLINILHWEKSDVSQVVFEDGTTWDVNKLKLMAIAGDETSETITGYNSNDIINAGGGNDIVYGLGGNDSLFGDAGYDTLYGGDGNDNLDAGADGGTLVGGQGDDNYFWGRGDGNVTIDNTRENSSPHFDRLILKAGVKPSDLLVRFQYSVNFRISFKDSSFINGGPNEALDLSNQISNGLLTNYAINEVLFDDGTIWDSNTLRLKAIEGTEFNDDIEAYTTDDIIRGFDGDDSIKGKAGNDTIFGDAGNDYLYGEEGNDVIYGGEGDDDIRGGEGNDQLYGGAGNDRLEGGEGDDILDGGSGNDHLIGGAGNDTFYWGPGSGKDTISTKYFTSEINDKEILVIKSGLRPNDVTLVREQDNLRIKSGADELCIYSYFTGSLDEIRFADDSSIVWTLQKVKDLTKVILNGTDGNDILVGSDGDDVLDGKLDNDKLDGKAGSDTYIFGRNSGQDTIEESVDLKPNVDIVLLDADILPVDVLVKRDLINPRDMILSITGSSSTLKIKNYFDLYKDSTGQQIEQIKFANGTIWSIDYVTLLAMKGTNDDDSLYGTLAADVINGGNGNDFIFGDAGDDILFGGDGDDIVNGGKGNDQINGGAGNDVLRGGQDGFDQFIFGRDSGNDVIDDDDNPDIIQRDRIVLEAGIVPSDITFSREGIDTNISLIISIAGSSSTLKINSYFEGIELNAWMRQEIQFADGTIWNAEQIKVLSTPAPNRSPVVSQPLLDQTANQNIPFNFAIPSATFSDPDLSDVLIYSASLANGAALPSWLKFNASTKTFSGTPTSLGTLSVKVTVKDKENLVVSDIFDIATGSSNQIIIGTASADTLIGNVGNDILTGHAGNDYLSGGKGNDIYVFNRGDGQDTIDNKDLLTATDTLRFATGVIDTDVLAFKSGNHLFFKLKNSTDQVAISNYYAPNTTLDGQAADYKIDKVEFSNAVSWNQTMIQTMVDRATNNKAPTLGTALANLNARTDTLFSTTVPANTIVDSDVGDTVTYSLKMRDGTALPSWLSFNASTRVISGTPVASNIGTLALTLWGTDNYGQGLGQFLSMTVTTAPVNRTPVVSSPLVDQTASTGIAFTYTVPSTSFTDPDAGDTLTYSATLADGSALPAWLTFNASTRKLSGTPTSAATVSVKVTAKDTGNLMVSDIFDVVVSVPNLTLNGTSAADTLTGGAGNDTLNGLAGNDKLIGGAGNDLLDGGTGNDTMIGGLGNDIYIVDSTSDVVTENANEGIDQVKSSVTYTLIANLESLLLTGTSAINGTGNTLDNLLIGNSGKNILNGAAGNDILQGMAGDDTLTDTLGNNIFDGGSGIDIITAGSGNDFIAGGIGNDTITTGTGADIIAFNRGDGMDTLNASTGKDNTISLGKGIKYADLLFKKTGNDLILVTGTSEQITLKDWYLNANNHSVANLQVVIEGTTDYNATSTNKLNNKKIEQFNFDGLVTKFDQARIANPSLTSWALSSSLLEFYLAGSDTAALGGDLAYQYAKNGNLSNFSMMPAHAIMVGGFGTGNQVLQATSALRDASINLA